MSTLSDSTSPEFWDVRFAAGKTPWDFHGVPTALRTFLASAKLGKVLIPGCGRGHEVEAFHQTGWDVTAIDFSPVAVEQARKALGPLGSQVILGDFFTHDLGIGKYDLIYERTFLCAFPPERWPDYVNRMTELLLPQGQLAGIFLYGEEPEPPPYPLSKAIAFQLFEKRFTLQRTLPVEDSLPLFAGKERWQEWKLKF